MNTVGEGGPNINKIKELILQGQYNFRDDQSPMLRNEDNYCMSMINNLWDMLGQPGDHFNIVQLLKRFDLALPSLFSSVVTMELNSDSSEVKSHAVEKFNIFWKLTAKDYNNYKPFQPDHERNRLKKLQVSNEN
jgi:hypothetical protein